MVKPYLLPVFSGALLLLSSNILLGQVSGQPIPNTGIPEWAAGSGIVVGLCGGPVFAIWLAYHYTTNIIPKKDKERVDEIKEINANFTAILLATEKRHEEHTTAAEKRHADHMTIITANSREDIRAAYKLQQEESQQLRVCIERLSQKIEESGCRLESKP